jgi:F-type H+-transporting ATPase subunit a
VNNIHLSVTNILVYILIAFFIIVSFYALTTKNAKISYRSFNLSKECIHDTIYGIVENQINKNRGQIYFPFIITLFMFILVNNLIGMIPYSFSTTSHFVLTFSLSFTIVLGATILGLKEHNIKFFSLFVPAGCPLVLLPALVLIEFISYLARNVSLGLRLAANIKV